MSSLVRVTRQDGTVVEFNCQKFESNGSVYVIEDTDGLVHVEPATGKLTTQLIDEIVEEIDDIWVDL